MKALSLAIVLFFSLNLFGQEKSVALVERPDRGSGSCVVIDRYQQKDGGWLGYAVTAYHVVEGFPSVRVKYLNGRSSSQCAVVATNKAADLAIIHVWAPDEAEPVEIQTEGPIDDVVLLGYPAGKYGVLKGKNLRKLGDNLFADILVRPGFSGGGAFTGDGKLVGCISGGWLWLRDEEDRQATWPTRAGGSQAIKVLLDGVKSGR
jgi:S1-C subfamily serine protease